MKAKTRQLAALHATVVLLRAALQRLKLTAKLRAALADPAAAASALDLAKAAKLASDVDAVGRDADLEGLTAIEADAEFLRSARQQIRGHAEVRSHAASSGGSNARAVACTEATLCCLHALQMRAVGLMTAVCAGAAAARHGDAQPGRGRLRTSGGK